MLRRAGREAGGRSLLRRAAPGTFQQSGASSVVSQMFGGASTQAGVNVSVEGGLAVSGVYAAIRLLADTISTLPFPVYQRQKGGLSQVEAFFDPVYSLIHDQPNPEMDATVCWSLVVTHLNTWGNAYLGKEWDAGGPLRPPDRLWPIVPSRVRVARERGEKVFLIRSVDGVTERRYTSADIIHITGLSLNGMVGLSPIELARETVGASIARDEFGNRFWAGGATPSGVLSVTGSLSDPGIERLEKQWDAKYGRRGWRRRGVAVLEQGAKFETIQMPLDDAQFVEQSKFAIQETSRWFRVPPSMIGGDTGGSLTYNTVEGDAIFFATHSIRPWCVRIERALAADQDLFPRGPRGGLYPKFRIDAILRADTATRFAAWSIATGGKAWMRPTEVRGLEELPPDPTFDLPQDNPGVPAAPSPTVVVPTDSAT